MIRKKFVAVLILNAHNGQKVDFTLFQENFPIHFSVFFSIKFPAKKLPCYILIIL